MSSHLLLRLLLKLSPRRVRDRYGDELLDLESELRARRHLARAGPRFVAAGSFCSESPCTQFTARRSTHGTHARGRATAVAQPPPSTRTRCVTGPRSQRRQTVYVDG